jgi:eukaryotic-like serine/threonine-protein kinase
MSSAEITRPLLQLGKYVVLQHIAAGGMAAIYRARHQDTGQEVALKVLSPEYAANPIRFKRFVREARAQKAMDHPNIVKMFDCDWANETYFIAMEFIEGMDVYDRVAAHGKLPVDEVVEILIQAARALSHAHAQGIVHRDVKPSNLLLTYRSGRLEVKLSDFGLALDWANLDESRLTKAGTTLGTVDYMAPEQARGNQLVDIRGDLYALGCTAYFMLTMRPPFKEGAIADKLYKHVHVTPPDPRDFNPKIPDGLIVILGKLLAKRPEDRYQTPSELIAELEKFRDPTPPAAVPNYPPVVIGADEPDQEEWVVYEAAEDDEETASAEATPPPSESTPAEGDIVRASGTLEWLAKPKPKIVPLLRELEKQPLWSRIAEGVSDAMVFISDPRVLVIAMTGLLALVILFLLFFWP